jgi:hypothetical protein
MRKQAIILILPFAIFLTETVSFVPALQEACAATAVKESSCCMIPPETSENECSSNKANDNEEPGSGCTDNPDCTTCPVCYTFIFQPRYELTTQQFVFKRHYALLETDYSSSYTSSVWKPPNGYFIHR